MSRELDRMREEIAEAGREAIADVQRTAEQTTAAIIRVIAERTGIRIGPPAGPPVMDATREQLMAADLRAQHAGAAMDIVLRRWSWGDARTLGELVRGLPEDVREKIADHLVKAGLS